MHRGTTDGFAHATNMFAERAMQQDQVGNTLLRSLDPSDFMAIAPYLERVFEADAVLIGRATLAMGLAMIAGNFLVAPAVRLVGSLRRTVLIFTGCTLAVMGFLVLNPDPGL